MAADTERSDEPGADSSWAERLCGINHQSEWEELVTCQQTAWYERHVQRGTGASTWPDARAARQIPPG